MNFLNSFLCLKYIYLFIVTKNKILLKMVQSNKLIFQSSLNVLLLTKLPLTSSFDKSVQVISSIFVNVCWLVS